MITDQIVNQGPHLKDEVERMFAELRAGGKTEVKEPSLQGMFAEKNQPFLQDWLGYSPKEEIKKLKMDVLVIGGAHDIQVTKSETADLGKAVGGAMLIDSMNHVFRNAPADFSSNVASYSDLEAPLNKEFLKEIRVFLTEAMR